MKAKNNLMIKNNSQIQLIKDKVLNYDQKYEFLFFLRKNKGCRMGMSLASRRVARRRSNSFNSINVTP